MKILTVGDCHVTNGQDLSRFDVLSKFIMDERPEHIVIMGDYLTFQCLSAWDKNKRRAMEGQRYLLEMEAGNEGLDRMLKDMNEYNEKRKRNRKAQYNPELIYINGNHEDRLDRYLETEPTFDGVVGVEKDLALRERGFTFIPYRTYHWINDIGFTHIPFNKVREISGVDITRKASMVTVKSCVFGHTHELHISNSHRMGQEHLQQVSNVGCFFEEHEKYVEGRMTQYWKGVVMLDSWKEGRYDITTHSLSKMRRVYE